MLLLLLLFFAFISSFFFLSLILAWQFGSERCFASFVFYLAETRIAVRIVACTHNEAIFGACTQQQHTKYSLSFSVFSFVSFFDRNFSFSLHFAFRTMKPSDVESDMLFACIFQSSSLLASKSRATFKCNGNYFHFRNIV